MRISKVIMYNGSGAPDMCEGARSVLSVRSEVRDWQPVNAEAAAVYDTMQPPDRQPDSGNVILYDGYVLQEIFSGMIPESESGIESLHVVFTDMLVGTFDQSYRYHARALIASNPAIVSVPGIVEAPARPRQYYVDAACMGRQELESKYAGQYLRYGDPGITNAAATYLMQAVSYHETGEAFCPEKKCRLYNAHWQSELLEQSGLCGRHQTSGIFT